jgi:hypothetical protein
MQIQRPFAVVTPTLDGDILATLVPVDAWFTTGQLHRVLPDRSQAGIRNTLTRLAEQGVVEFEQVGATRRYRLNRDHIAADALRGLANMRTTLLGRMEALIQTWTVPPVYAAVFGSTVRGQMRPDSDLDVFIVRPDRTADAEAWDAQISDFSSKVTRWTGNDTRVLEMSEIEVVAGTVASGGRAQDPVLVAIATEGLTIYGSTTWLRQLIRNRRTSRVKDQRL